MVIGCSGSGKSTFSRKLASILDLELHHLDQYYWKPNWEETPQSEWKEIVKKLASGSEWIIDGNFGGTMDIRIDRADTIIYLDIPTYKCLWRITKRIIKNHGKVRADMPEGCPERFDLEFYHYVLTYNLLRRKKKFEKLNKLKEQKDIYIFKNDLESHRFLQSLR